MSILKCLSSLVKRALLLFVFPSVKIMTTFLSFPFISATVNVPFKAVTLVAAGTSVWQPRTAHWESSWLECENLSQFCLPLTQSGSQEQRAGKAYGTRVFTL